MIASQKAYKQLVRKVVIPVIGLVALLLLGLLVALWKVAAYQTATAQAEEVRLARSALAMRGEYMRKIVADYGTWDEAYENLVVRPDADWADENIGLWSSSHYGFDKALVAGADGRVTYEAAEGRRASPGMSLPQGAEEILRRASSGEGASFGFVLSTEGPAIAAAAPIRRVEDAPFGAGERPVLLLVDVLDASTLRLFERAYPLSHLRLEPASYADPAAAPVTGADGVPMAMLAWDGERPGDALLRAAIPIWLAVASAFGLLIWIGGRQVRASARLIAMSEHRARHDALTDLPNRMALFETLDAAARALSEGGSPFAVAYLDLDGFKTVNDAHGHAAGDEVLRAAAARMRQIVGAGDVVARLGGDEFALILFGCAGERRAFQALAHRLIAAIERPVPLGDGMEARVGATVGLSLAPGDSADPLVLLRNADHALYAGKRGGKRRAVFHDGTAAALSSAA